MGCATAMCSASVRPLLPMTSLVGGVINTWLFLVRVTE